MLDHIKKLVKERWFVILRNTIILVMLFALLFAITVMSLNAAVIAATKDRIISVGTAAQLTDIDCILVLGCGVRGDGTPSDYLRDRLDTAFALYEAGASDRLLMTGDHGTVEYDEVNTMLAEAEAAGIDRKYVFTDHAGFSTYESIYRAKEIFGADRIIIVSQEYHLYRSLYIAEKLGIEAYGVSGDFVVGEFQQRREFFARTKDFFFALIKPEPTYLGDYIPISGDAYPSHDN
ncbi:MAG: vancomycin high temperature exclusion protein [Eubacteriales bacterium]